ncbi:hypothetical protein KBZ21_39655, partial [Streptomyces sp. A73]|nr:hypothetical protein [Streptomyces sp. A73]
GMGVRTARLLYREAGFERGQRKKIMTSPAERKRMHELNNSPRDRHLSGYAWSRYANRVGPRPTPDARPWEALSLLGAAWPAA